MEASIAAIASADKDGQAAGIEARSVSVLPWLACREQRWLMIFDGADGGYEEVEAFIPAGKRGCILISTRNSNMQRLTSSFDSFINVIELDQVAAATLFIKSARLNSPSPSEQAHIEAIVQELCCLPLAVDQAAAFIASGVYRVDEYLDTYKRHRLRLMDDPTFKGASNYGRAVYTTWDISFAELERRAASEASELSTTYKAAILLLQLFSFFHFDGIREDTFRRAAKTQGKWLPPLLPNSPLLLLLQQTEDDDWDFFYFRQGIRVLSMFALVHSVGNGSICSMHRLVHQWMQDRLPKFRCTATGLLAADVLSRSEDYGRCSDDYAHRRALFVHLITLTACLKQNNLMHQLSADALQRMARIYAHARKPVDAEALLRRALFLVEKDGSEVTERHMDIMHNLATALGDSNKLREAEVIQRHILEWQEKHLETEHPSIPLARRNIALTLCRLGQYRAAKEMQVPAIAWQKKHFGMNHPDTYRAMSDLAFTLYKLGELTDARRLQEQVLEWQKVHLGMDHPDTYRTMGNLAFTLYELREFVKARGLQVQALGWRKVHLGLKHKATVHAMNNLANTLERLGEITEAQELRARVAEVRNDSDTSSERFFVCDKVW
jgi:tetratricopeptide (TPR) repeat protein